MTLVATYTVLPTSMLAWDIFLAYVMGLYLLSHDIRICEGMLAGGWVGHDIMCCLIESSSD